MIQVVVFEVVGRNRLTTVDCALNVLREASEGIPAMKGFVTVTASELNEQLDKAPDGSTFLAVVTDVELRGVYALTAKLGGKVRVDVRRPINADGCV